MTNLPQRKSIHLPPHVYAETGRICHSSFCLNLPLRLFENRAYAAAAVAVIKERAQKTSVPVYAYCVMPDHVHLLIEPSTTCDIHNFVGGVKGQTQHELWKLGHRGKIWERRHWDRFLRQDDEVGIVARYIANNPVRKEMVAWWGEYGFNGSLVFELEWARELKGRP